jgi:hypothetical protein
LKNECLEEENFHSNEMHTRRTSLAQSQPVAIKYKTVVLDLVDDEEYDEDTPTTDNSEEESTPENTEDDEDYDDAKEDSPASSPFSINIHVHGYNGKKKQ